MNSGLLHDPGFFSAHNSDQHPENVHRLSMLGDLDFGSLVDPRPATDAELQAVHTAGHLQTITGQCLNGGGFLDPDTYCCPESEIVARAASGGLVDLCFGVLDGAFANGLALVRPPGHHATADQAMGFCLYNHIAVAAAALKNRGVSRVCIVDFDVHHGNGTQDIFYEDDSVLYLSSHQYPHYPGTGSTGETGRGKGVGFTLNHHLEAGSGDDELLAGYQDHLLPRLADFRPEFVLVSAGFDGHADDPLAGLNTTTAGYRQLMDLLIQEAGQWCEGKIVFVLEGGYNPRALADCLGETMTALQVGSSE